jgi:DNA-binding NarL/FixJ family response regulator
MDRDLATILIVEDEMIIGWDLRNRINAMGYQVIGVFSTGTEAFHATKNLHPDLILMDIRIKGSIDGIELARLIQSHHRIPIIFLTGQADHATVLRAKQIGPAGYLCKPFGDQELRDSIQSALKR